MSNTVIITRKYNLIPEKCDQKIWKKKVREFLASEILRMNELISQKGNKQAWKEKLRPKQSSMKLISRSMMKQTCSP